jgi:hypothetical protein
MTLLTYYSESLMLEGSFDRVEPNEDSKRNF